MTQMPHFTPVISTLNAFPEARNSLSPERKWSDNRAERFWCNNFGAFAFVSLSPLLNSTHFLFLIFGFIHITVKKLCKRGSPIIRHNGRKAANIAMIFKLLFFLAKFSVPGALEIAAWSIGGALLIDLCLILIVFGFFSSLIWRRFIVPKLPVLHGWSRVLWMRMFLGQLCDLVWDNFAAKWWENANVRLPIVMTKRS